MDVYFYCSYERSPTGFFHTRLEGSELVPVEGGHTGLPEALGWFFSYDQFLLLWRSLAPPVNRAWQRPEPTGVLLGLRELTGVFADGRRGTVNLALYAGPEEESAVRRTALAILGNFDAFQEMLLGWLRTGGPCGYQLDGVAFRAWLDCCAQSSRLRVLAQKDDSAVLLLPYLRKTQPPRLERDLLHLAVCTGSWQQTAEAMGNRANWYWKPRCALSGEQFRQTFTGKEPLWVLEPEA